MYFLARLPVWIISILVCTWFLMKTTINFSREIAEKYDPSAMAWTIALPFIIPVWIIDSCIVIIPLATIYEICAYIFFRPKAGE